MTKLDYILLVHFNRITNARKLNSLSLGLDVETLTQQVQPFMGMFTNGRRTIFKSWTFRLASPVACISFKETACNTLKFLCVYED